MHERTLRQAEFDAFAETYDSDVQHSLYGLKPDYFTKVKADFIIDLVNRHFGTRSGLEALDVGCGIGNYHAHLGSRFETLRGVDVSQASLRRAAAKNGHISYHHYDGHRLPFEDQTFQIAFTICVMHHVTPAQWGNFASEMKRVLQPGGLALVFEHNPANPLTRRIVNRCEFDRDAVLLSRSKAEKLLAEAGLKNVRSRCILSIPSTGAWTRNLDFMIGRLGLGAQYVVSAEAAC
jgi:ubiquinone/menaquinone biosynthesis C-methylase UbiE